MASFEPDRRKHLRTTRAAAAAILVWIAAAQRSVAADSASALEFFETRIRPVLVEKCYPCHSAAAPAVQADLRLDTAEGSRRGGASGPVIVPGRPEDSLLVRALRYEALEMPPAGKLPDSVIADFEAWIGAGAVDPRTGGLPDPAAASVDPSAHWAFRRPVKPQLPPVAHPVHARSPIDAFIVAALDSAGIAPSPPAEPRALWRRLYIDLTGLPPSAEELAALSTRASDAEYEETVDRLLASPRFGERWARHWLDVARYADTKGYVFQEDRNYKGAYKYRDWVIDAFNSDLAFDRFAVAQLAADQLDDPRHAPAVGFLTLGRRFLNDPQLINDDRIDLMCRGFMGLTAACARCHDHKYEPIPTLDYYSLYGVLANSEETLRDDLPPTLADKAERAPQAVFLRGNAGNPGPPAPPRFFQCISSGERREFTRGSGRLELAEAIASRDNPLTARVWVNRVWGHLFGNPLVTTPSDFGTRGAVPSHPELLDWLAVTFIDDGWSTKRLIRRIVLSNAYRQASDVRPEAEALDAENRLVWRMNRRRLDLESMRDGMLHAAGQLDLTMGGPSVEITAPPFAPRRTVYGIIERQNLPAFFRTFDFASPNVHTPLRPDTASPQQALFMLNSPFALAQARELARRTVGDDGPEASGEAQRRIARLYRCVLNREPTEHEAAEARAFVASPMSPDELVISGQSPWQFGWGSYEPASDRVEFHHFTAFVNNSWQGGADVPDPHVGWAMLNAAGGHPGDQTHQAVRRWIAPIAGTARISGTLRHPDANGDGVRALVASSVRGRFGSWTAAHGAAETQAEGIPVSVGDALDFVVDCRDGVEFDTFEWPIEITLQDSNGAAHSWRSQDEFHGKPPAPPPLDRWEELAHVLLMCNEFIFVD